MKTVSCKPVNRRSYVAFAWLLFGIVLSTTTPVYGEAVVCRPLQERGVTVLAELIEEALQAETCRYGGMSTNVETSDITLVGPHQQTYHLTITPNGCMPDATFRGRQMSAHVPEETSARCEASVLAIEGLLSDGSFQEATGDVQVEDGVRSEDGRVRADVRENPDLVPGARILFAAMLLALIAALYRGAKLARDCRSWRLLLLLAFVGALIVRLAVQPALANWYTQVLPVDGMIWSRFGPGILVVQETLRALFPWHDRTMFGLNLILGAAAIPLAGCFLRAISVDRSTTFAIIVFFALTPLHVRVSASPSEQIVACTLLIAAMWAWTSGVRRREYAAMAFAFLAATAVVFTRADMFFQAAAVPIWSFVLTRQEREGARFRRMSACCFWVLWIAVGGVLYRTVIEPAHHPQADYATIVSGAKGFLLQYGEVAFSSPHFVSRVALILSVVGVFVLVRSRPRLLLASVFFLFVAYAPVLQDLRKDELLGGRYFLVTLLVFHIASGFGLAAVLRLIRWKVGSKATIVAFGLVMGFSAWTNWTGYTQRYTFQDEYDFLRHEFAALPDGCTVFQANLRSQAFQRDLDCCLNVPVSPLTIAYPELVFRTHGPETDLQTVVAETECVAYYQTAACSLGDTEDLPDSYAKVAEQIANLCDSALAHSNEELAHAAVSDHTTNNLFDSPPTVRLFRLLRSDE